MDTYAQENDKRYNRWLLIMSLLGSLSGWGIQGLLEGQFVFWWFLVFFVGTFFFLTGLGGTIIEALMVVILFGIPLFVMPLLLCLQAEEFCEILSPATLKGGFTALAVSQIGFGLAREGVLGNQPFN